MIMKKWLILFTLGFLLVNVAPALAAEPAQISIFSSGGVGTADVCRYHEAGYEVEITNNLDKRETFEIESHDSGCITLSESDVTLEAGETKVVYLWYNPDKNVEPGRYNFPVDVTATTTGQTVTEEFEVEVLGCHDVDLFVEKESETSCIGQNNKIDFEVYNDGTGPETFKLETDKGTLSQEKVRLSPEEKKKVSLTVKGADKEKSEEIEIRAKSKSSWAESAKTVSLKTERCYNSYLSITPSLKEACAGLENEYEVNVENTGTKKDTFSLESTRGKLEKKELTLKPGQKKSTTLKFTPKELKNYSIKVKAKGKSESMGKIKVKGRNCKDVTVVSSPADKTVCENDEEIYTATIKNEGKVKDSYRVVSNRGSLEKNYVELAPGESEDIEVKVNAKTLEEGRQSITVRTRSKTISKVEDYSTSVINVGNCYDLNLSVSHRQICKTSCDVKNITLYTINLENTGSKENKYKIEVDGPNWLSLTPEELSVEAGEKGKSYLYASVPYNISDKFNISIRVEDETGLVERETKEKLVVGDIPSKGDLPKNRTKEGKKIIEKIRDEWNNFTRRLGNITKTGRIIKSPQRSALVLSIIVGLIVVGLVVYFEGR